MNPDDLRAKKMPSVQKQKTMVTINDAMIVVMLNCVCPMKK
jgi:hypothetical protein